MKQLSTSVMCADLLNMEKAVADLEKAGIDYLHVDIMDGSFVPNITLGFDLINAIKKVSNIPLDIHMMVQQPVRFLDSMHLGAEDIVCVHYESDVHVHRTLEQIRKKGCKTGLALNPQTPVSCVQHLSDYTDMLLIMTVSPGFAGQKMFTGALEKTKQARALLDSSGYAHIPIEVDGNISFENGKNLSQCGADIFVLGTSSLFIPGKDMKQSAEEFRAVL